MEASETQNHEVLLEEIGRARERLDDLVRDLRKVDGELEALAEERHHYGLLEKVCSGLEALRDLGADHLFWNARTAGGDGPDHVRIVRGRVDVFEKRLREVEDRRQEMLEAIQGQQESAEILEDDLFELQRREEERKFEWVLERELDESADRVAVMPWSRGSEDDERFRKALAATLLASLLLGLLLPMVNLPLPDPWQVAEVPDRLTRLVRELPPPPPPVQQVVEPEPSSDPEEPKLAQETTPKQPDPKETAASKGILAFREKFSGLAATEAPARLGSDARITSAAEGAIGRPTRNMVASNAPGSSGGINLASLSRDIGGGGGQPAGVSVARVTSSIGGVAGESRPLSSGPGPARTDEEIQIVFDRHKAALYRLYNRELRRDPTLRGQMVLRLRIEPDGSVTLCEVKSTDMDAPNLAMQVAARVKTFDFGAKEDVPPITILYPIDFLPAT